MTVRLLLTIATALAFNLTMTGEPVDSLYITYLNAHEGDKAQAATNVFRQLARIHFTDSVLQFSKKEKAEIIEANVHYWMAEYYYDQELYEDALVAGNHAFALLPYIKDDYFKSDLLGIVANTQFRLGAYDSALKTLLMAHDIDKKLGDEQLISSDMNTLAAIYMEMNQPELGINCIENSIAIERKLNRQDRIAIRLGLASELYLMNNEPGKAMAAINEAYAIDNQAGRAEKAAIRLSQKGAILEATSRLDEALRTVNKALDILSNYDNTYSMAVCYNQLGSIHHKLNRHQQAIDCYKKGLELSIKCGSPKTERQAEKGLWEVLRTDNPAVALLHLERYTALNDSLLAKSNLARLKATDQTILSQEADGNHNGTPLQRYRGWLIASAVFLGLMIALALAGLFHAWLRNKSALKLIKQSQDMREHVLNNITTELQTPLTVIMGAGDQLTSSDKASIDENKQIGQMIVHHGNKMLNLVNQLLDFNNVKNATELPERKQGDIVMFVRMLVDNFTDQARQQHIQLQFSSPLKTHIVVFVPDFLRKIVHALISNAIKFTPRGGMVTVSLDCTEHNKIRLVVADTGPGIPLDERDSIYEPLLQKHPGDDDVVTGLDLALVNQLVQALDGTITMESELNHGTSFTITLPAQSVQHQVSTDTDRVPQFAEKRIRQNGNAKQKPLVFIVENSEDIAFFIANNLRERYELRIARDGREAFAIAQDLAPDLIVTSIIMPIMDGKELIRKIRTTPSLKHIPIIAMTSRTSESERISCIEAGADAVLVKPFNSSELRLVTKRLISQRSSIRELMAKNGNGTSTNPSHHLSKEDNEFINRLVNVIHAQMSREDINMEHIAAALSISRKQLRTRVMDITGMTPVAFALQVRLNYARRLISTQNISLTEIAIKCGFQNISHFSKAFKQQFGVSPTQFRKNMDDITAQP